MKLTTALLSCLGLFASSAINVKAYNITGAGDISLTDTETDISDIETVFTDEQTTVTVTGVEWNEDDQNVTTVLYETFVNGKLLASGKVNVTEGLPDSIDAGIVVVKDRGTAEFYVKITSGETEAESSREIQAFGNGVAIIPLLVVLGLAMTTKMVRSWQMYCSDTRP